MLKKGLIIIAVFASLPNYLARIHQLQNVSYIAAYLVLFLILFSALLLTSYGKSTPLRCLWGGVLSISLVFCESYRRITGNSLDYPSFVSLLSSAAFIPEALTQFARPVLISALNGLVLFSGIALKPSASRIARGWLPAAAPVVPVALLIGMLYIRGGGGATDLPSSFTPLAYAGLLAYEDLSTVVVKRQPIALRREPSKISHDIMLIIDESVRGDYLDIDSSRGVRSGLENRTSKALVYNFGLASSITNCSAGTNMSLRYGGTRDNYRTIIKTMPSIWQYARNAGLKTIYIDAQRTGGRLQNRMTAKDLQYIDRFIQFDDIPIVQRDMAAAKLLAAFSNDGIPEFIVVNKSGAHFPVHDKYPDEFMVYKPALPRGGFKDVGDTGSRVGFDGEWGPYKNSYKNTILWDVGQFFDRVFAGVNFNNAIVIYTSDHGQNFHERGDPGLNTHCSSQPTMEEGLVPLVVIAGRQLDTLDWRKNLKADFNRASHYNIFPTLLTLMKYDRAGIRKVYGPSLIERVDDPFTFNARFDADFHLKPIWVKIDLAHVIGPDAENNVVKH